MRTRDMKLKLRVSVLSFAVNLPYDAENSRLNARETGVLTKAIPPYLLTVGVKPF